VIFFAPIFNPDQTIALPNASVALVDVFCDVHYMLFDRVLMSVKCAA
jgi:hypothetical protein